MKKNIKTFLFKINNGILNFYLDSKDNDLPELEKINFYKMLFNNEFNNEEQIEKYILFFEKYLFERNMFSYLNVLLRTNKLSRSQLYKIYFLNKPDNSFYNSIINKLLKQDNIDSYLKNIILKKNNIKDLKEGLINCKLLNIKDLKEYKFSNTDISIKKNLSREDIDLLFKKCLKEKNITCLENLYSLNDLEEEQLKELKKIGFNIENSFSLESLSLLDKLFYFLIVFINNNKYYLTEEEKKDIGI